MSSLIKVKCQSAVNRSTTIFFVQPNHIDKAQTAFLSFSTHVGQMMMKNDHSYHCKPDSLIKDCVFLSES